KMPRTQPCRKRLAIHARQLALKSRLQILRRSRRALLRGLEQARRSALAHHVHRIASMGARVLINGTWYKAMNCLCLMGVAIVFACGTAASAQTQEVSRMVSGQPNTDIRVGVYVNVKPDCTSGPLPSIRLATP